jgi:hypothetical protein
MIPFLIVLFHLLGLISSIHAVMGARTSQGAIACDWCQILNSE